MSEKEARTHVRIDDRILLRFRRLTPEEFQEKMLRYRTGEESPWIDPLRPPGEARKLDYHLKKLREKNRDLAEVLEILALRMDRLLLDMKAEEIRREFREISANLSGAGLRVPLGERPQVGDLYELDIGLLPEYYFFRAYGEVVRLEDSEVAFRFVWITEDDQDRLVQHVFRKQILQIQISRRAVEK
ncbi:PilZ domain-containing protein [Thermosulfurimonas marina]|uniref:PilZ domain-containing protein n=1 Tax=Thermosulfurimonas marina TaxID=2047767 RepID=A0A6H1WUR8_9BACT|nr:PilZ domain-containing protein [Thermosulfurimonas marina]QJA06930.1 PilZ domain-containing protein [Thermosulfurimonas marina]